MRYKTRVGGRSFDVAVERREGQVTVTMGGREYTADLRWIEGQERYSLILDGVSYEIFVEERGDGYRLYIQGQPFDVASQDERRAALEAITARPGRDDAATAVRAPMPGMVIVLDVAPGQAIEAGRTLLVIEAMKMHNEVRAPREGVVGEVRTGLGQRVEKDQVLVTLK
jgi:pyruvate carboxylase subunit B